MRNSHYCTDATALPGRFGTRRPYSREDTYTASDSGGVQYYSVVSDVEADGVLGFLYRRFGSRNMGKAFLSSQKKYFETTQR